MKYDLAAMWRRTRNPRRRSVTLRPVVAPSTLATDLLLTAYNPIVATWERAIPVIVAQYEQSLSQITGDSPADLGRTIEGVEGDLARVLLSLRLRLEQWTLKVERWQRGKWRGAVLSATGVDVGTLIGAGGMRGTLGAAVERNVSLVKSVADQTRSRIADAVFRGLSQRRTANEVAKDIRGAVAMSRRRARNIASDQLTKLSSSLAAERRREAGIDTWEWMASHKQNYRPEHQARDGKRYADDNAPADLPGELINCGCTERAVLSLDGEF